MKTVCLLNYKVIMSQDGEAVEAMTQNAQQYAGATVEVVTDEKFNSLIALNVDYAAIEKQATAKASALAKLAALGLTQDEVKALIG